MADQKITDLDAAGTITGAELIELVQDGSNVKCTLTNALALIKADAVEPLTDSTTGVEAGTLVAVGDTSAGDESANINANFASLNAQVEALKAALVAAGTLTEFTP